MKNFKSYIFVLLASFAMTSCLVDDDTLTDNYGDGANMVGFTGVTTAAAFSADGDAHNFVIPMSVTGPNMREATEAVVAQISVDEGASTAISGTHYLFDETSITLSPDTNLIKDLNLTILTEGIVPPLAESPYVVLNVTSVSGGNGAIINGRTGKIKVTINYLCPSELAGTYDVVIQHLSAGTTINRTDVIVDTGKGTYRTGVVGHWNPAQFAAFNPGFAFSDVCDVITIPQQNLVDQYSNLVEGVLDGSSVNPDTGVITFTYNICTDSGCNKYIMTYTPTP